MIFLLSLFAFTRTEVHERKYENICRRIFNAKVHFSNFFAFLSDLKVRKPKVVRKDADIFRFTPSFVRIEVALNFLSAFLLAYSQCMWAECFALHPFADAVCRFVAVLGSDDGHVRVHGVDWKPYWQLVSHLSIRWALLGTVCCD